MFYNTDNDYVMCLRAKHESCKIVWSAFVECREFVPHIERNPYRKRQWKKINKIKMVYHEVTAIVKGTLLLKTIF